MTDLIDLYCREQTRRGYSNTTITARRRYLRTFEAEVGVDATREAIEDWLDQFAVAKTRAVVTSHLHCFFAWAVEEELIAEDPTRRIRAPKVPRKLPRPMHDDDLEKALANATPLFRCWLMLGAYVGLRCQEVAGLQREDIITERMLLRVTDSKGGDEGIVPLRADVLEALELYGMPESGPVFTNASGKQLSAGTVSHRFGDYLRSLGIKSPPHSLRHFFGTEIQSKGHDIRTTQELMRHKNIASTVIYTKFDQQAGRQAVDMIGAR